LQKGFSVQCVTFCIILVQTVKNVENFVRISVEGALFVDLFLNRKLTVKAADGLVGRRRRRRQVARNICGREGSNINKYERWFVLCRWSKMGDALKDGFIVFPKETS